MKKLLLVFLLYFLVAAVYTYPLVFKLGSSIYGYSGDNFGAIHYLWWWKYATLNHLDLRNSFLEQAPFGFKVDSETGSIFYFWPLKILTLISNEVVAYNLMLLLSFPLAALAMYFLVRFILTHFFDDRENWGNASTFWIALWAGFVFSFSPYHFWKAYNHLDLSLIWPFPLAILFLFKVLGQVKNFDLRLRTIWLCAFFTAATVLTNFYYGFFLFISFAAVYVFFFIFYRPKLKTVFVSAVFNFLFTLLFLTPFIAPTVIDAYINKGAGQSAARVANYDRPLLDVVSLSARPWDYLIPSQDNPVFGNLSTTFYNKWIRDQGKDFKVISGPVHERTIYLGFASIILTLLGVLLLILKKDFREKYGKFLAISLLVSSVLILVSMPPYIFLKGNTLYLPSYFLYIVAPMFRTYSRIGIFVLMFMVLGAAVVLKYLFRNLSRTRLTSYFLILTSFSIIEFANVPPSKVINLVEPKALEYIGQQPGDYSFIVYPKEFNVAELLVFQSQYQKGFLNFHSQSPYYKLWDYLSNFHDPKVPQLLSSLGVKYAAFQKKLIFAQPNPVDDLWYTRALRDPIGGLPPGFTLEKDYGDSSVYSISAESIGFIVFNGGSPEVFPKVSYVLRDTSMRIYLANVQDNPKVEFTMQIKSVDGKELSLASVSGENVSIQRTGDNLQFSFNKEMGFIDISGLQQGTVIRSVNIKTL